MFRKYYVAVLVLMVVAGLVSQPALAETLNQVLTTIKNEAQSADPSFKGFSAARGEQFFKQKHGNEWSCSSCHTDNPAVSGKHAKTGKIILPLAPAVNVERFTSLNKVAKWFKRNCNDVLDRVCTPQEKGDVMAYLLTVKN